MTKEIQTFGFFKPYIRGSCFTKVDQGRSRFNGYAPDSFHIYGAQNNTLNSKVSAPDS